MDTPARVWDLLAAIDNEIRQWQDIVGGNPTEITGPHIAFGVLLLALYTGYRWREHRRSLHTS